MHQTIYGVRETARGTRHLGAALDQLRNWLEVGRGLRFKRTQRVYAPAGWDTRLPQDAKNERIHGTGQLPHRCVVGDPLREALAQAGGEDVFGVAVGIPGNANHGKGEADNEFPCNPVQGRSFLGRQLL